MGYAMNRTQLLVAIFISVVPLAGQAQTAPARPPAKAPVDSTALAEVVVTATRRAENLQEVPISLSAFTGETLEKLNARGASDYLMQTPNVSFTQDKQSGSRGLTLSVRGVNNLVTGENAFVNSIGIYLDEFSIASVPNGVANPFMPDMERVEVLRGPQGTYFGRNALGGALNLTTREPTDRTEGQLTLGAESYSSYGNAENITATFNVPISDTFKLRGTAFYEDGTGIVRNVGPGNGADHQWANLRLKALWTPTDRTRVSFSFLYGNDKQGADETVPSGVNDLDTIDTFQYQPGTAFDPGTGFFPHNQSKFSADLQQKNEDSTAIYILNVAHKFSDRLTWKTVVGLISTTNDRFFDNDLVGNLDLLSRTNHYSGKSYSLESRLEGQTDAVNWVVGALSAKDEQDQYNNVAISGNPTATLTRNGLVYGFLPPFPTGLGLSRVAKRFSVASYAVFADATWKVTGNTELFAGARYTTDDVDRYYQGYGAAPGLNPDPSCTGFFGCWGNFARTPAVGTASFDDITPRAGVRYKFTDDTSAYATISRGYKAGGLSTGNSKTGAPLAGKFNKETLWNYELGLKAETADHRVRVNAAVFYMKWTDMQMEAFRLLVPGDLSTNFEQTINIPSADAKGVELELTARATERLTLGAAIGYLDATMLENQACTVGAADPNCVGGHKLTTITGGFNVDLKGLPIPNSPKLTASAYGEYRVPMGANSLWVRGEYQHRDSQYSDIEGVTNQQTLGGSPNSKGALTRFVPADQFPYKVPAWNVFNLRGGYDWGQLSLALYALNLADEHYYTGTYMKFGLSGMRLRPNPRTLGGNFTVHF